MREHCEPPVVGVRFDGAADARPAPGVLDAIADADTVLVCPSNPVISIGPILAVPGVRDALVARRDRVVGVSPIIAGRPVKGPADRLMGPMGIDVSCVGVAREYRAFCSALVIDTGDAAHAGEIEALGVRAVVADTLDDRRPGRGRAWRATRSPPSPDRQRANGVVQPLTVIPVHGVPEVRPDDPLAPLDRRRRGRAGHSPARRRLHRRHPEDRLQGRRAAGRGRSRRPRGARAHRRERVGAHPASARRPHHQRDPARVRVRERGRRPVERRRRLGGAAPGRQRPLGPPHPRRAARDARRRGRGRRSPTPSDARGARGSPTSPSASPGSPRSSTCAAPTTPSAVSCRSPRSRSPTRSPPPPSW